METQRRAAIAVLAFVVVAGGLALGVYAVAGQQSPTEPLQSLTIAQRAYQEAQDDLAQVSGPGIDLITEDPRKALELLSAAYAKLDEAQLAGYPAGDVARLRDQVSAGLDRLYRVVPVRSNTVFTFPADTPVTLESLVRGSDGAPYVLDTASKTVWRIDLARETAKPVAAADQKVPGGKVGDPKTIALAGPDVIIVDQRNNVWRWRPIGTKGDGTLVAVKVEDASTWGDDVRILASFVSNYSAAFYKLYFVDPSEQNIRYVSPSSDGSGYLQKAQDRLPTDRPVDGITDLLLDGDIFVAENGAVERVIPASGWSPQEPRDGQLRPNPRYTIISSPNLPNGDYSKRVGLLYAFDVTNRRIVAFSKGNGDFVEQYLLADGDGGWAGLKDMVVLPGADADSPATLWWISGNALHTAVLAAAEGPGATPSPTPTATPAPTPKPTKTPKPKKTPKPTKTPRP
jgi:hypothetical protein